MNKRKGSRYRRSQFSKIYQEKLLENRKSDSDKQICLSVVIKSNYKKQFALIWALESLYDSHYIISLNYNPIIIALEHFQV